MVDIKRKVIQIANSTQLISLPRKWTQQYNVNKGDELELKEQGNKILISTEKDPDGKIISIDPPHLKNITERFVTTAFRAGVDEVRINFSSDKNPELLEYISTTLDGQTIGYEILSQEKNHFIIKDLSGGDSTSYETALRRSFILLTSMANDSYEALKKRDVPVLKEMYFRDRSINKFTNFCSRLLLKKGPMDFKNTAFHYHFVRSFEALADQYSLMCTYYANNDTPVHKKVINSFKDINEVLMGFYDLFYKYDKVELNNLFSKLRDLEAEMRSHFSLSKSDPVITYYLSTIVRRIKEIFDSLIEFRIVSND